MSSQGSLFNADTSGVDVAFLWFGQIVDESTWVENHAREDGKHSLRTRDDFQGYGYRYKVRIFGRELDDKKTDKTTKDEELYMAEVSMPVTAGSGHGGSVQTPNLRQGNYVFGFYKDGVEGTEPIIFGLLPNHAQTRLFGADPESGFTPRTGGNGLGGSKQFGNKNLLGEGPDGGNPLNESAGGNYVLDVRDIDVVKEQRTHHLPKTYDCDARGGGAIKAVTRVINDIQEFLGKIKSAANSFAGQVSDVLDGINSLVEDAALLITDIMKGVIDKMRGFAENQINKISGLIAHAILPPNGTSTYNEILQIILDVLACLFNKLIKGLLGAVTSLLSSLTNKLLGGVDAAFCAAESFMGSLLSGILGPLAKGLSGLSGLIDNALGAASSIFSGIFNALDSILGFIAFLTCDEDADCSAGDGWSFWYGDGSFNIETPDLKTSIQNSALSGGGGGGCDTSPKTGQPPKVKFSGGGGTGASANAIISSDGRLIGFDIINGGNGYTSSPTVTLSEDGPGSGAVLFARLEDDNSFLGGRGGETSRNPDDDPNSENNLFGKDNTKDVDLKINTKKNSNLEGALKLIEGSFSPDILGSGEGENLIWNGGPLSVGGEGGEPVKLQETLSSGALDERQKFIKHRGEFVKVCGRKLFVNNKNNTAEQVTTDFGPLKWNSVGGKSVTVGGEGGESLILLSSIVECNRAPLKTKVNIPLFEPEKELIFKGPYQGTFEGRGTYNNGSFKGRGTLKFKVPEVNLVRTDAGTFIPGNEEKEYSLTGNFSGFDSNLRGEGTGTFNGIGIVRNGRFKGDGKFTVDSVEFPIDDSNDDEIQFPLTSNKGVVLNQNSDGTGSLKDNNKKPTSIVFVKLNSVGGSPLSINGQPVTIGGTQVKIGGSGGHNLLVKRNLGPNDDILNVDGLPVLVGGYKVSVKGTGVPLVVGAPKENTPSTVGDRNLTFGDGNISPAFDLGSTSNGKSADGTFAGPDGSSVQEIIVIDSGDGYLNKPDGSIYLGGNKISDRDGTIVFNDRVGYNFYPPNRDVNVIEGDLVYLPPGTDVRVYDNLGEELQKITGLGLEKPIVIEESGTLTTPVYNEDVLDLVSDNFEGDLPTSSNGSYPVILKLNDVLISNPGINYSPGDKIDITPQNGAILEPIYNRFGKLVEVEIVDPGIGFNNIPDISIKTTTGINAIIIPIFGVQRKGDVSEISDEIPAGTKLVEVIDCVGKINFQR